MNRKDAREIAEKIINEQLKQMFDNAKIGIKDWTKASNVNKGISKGVAWNILAKDFDINHNYHILAKTNMIREFGEFLSDELKIHHSPKQYKPSVHHNPQF